MTIMCRIIYTGIMCDIINTTVEKICSKYADAKYEFIGYEVTESQSGNGTRQYFFILKDAQGAVLYAECAIDVFGEVFACVEGMDLWGRFGCVYMTMLRNNDKPTVRITGVQVENT